MLCITITRNGRGHALRSAAAQCAPLRVAYCALRASSSPSRACWRARPSCGSRL